MPSLPKTGRLLAPLLFLALPGIARAEPPRLLQPLDCTLGQDCQILQYVDRRPGPGVEDIACGAMANDGHKGTDFALPSLAAMAAGVPVRAAAAGRIRGLRDGMPDVDASRPDAPEITGRECGNGVTIDHGHGWRSQYCHLRAGSVRVRKGQRIAAGDTIGLVGMSGAATFPHLHFSLHHAAAVMDPFRPDATRGCGQDGAMGLWRTPMSYRAGGFLALGVGDRVPDYAAVKAGLPEMGLPETPPALVVWALAFGGRAGDEIHLSLEGPQGPLGTKVLVLEKDRPRFYRAWGRRAPTSGFPPGPYRARVEQRRGATLLDRRDIAFTLP